MQNLWRVPAFARRFRLDGERDDIGWQRNLGFCQFQPGKGCTGLFRIFQMCRIVRMIVLQPVEDFRTFHRSFGGNQRHGAFVKRFPVEGRAIGHLAEGLGRLVVVLLRQPGLADTQPQDDGFLPGGQKTEKGDFGLPEFTPVEQQIGEPELRAEMVRCRSQHLRECNIGGRLLAGLIEFEGLFVDKTDAARVQRAAEIFARAGAEQRAAQLLLLRPEEIFVRLVAAQEIIGFETLLDCPAARGRGKGSSSSRRGR